MAIGLSSATVFPTRWQLQPDGRRQRAEPAWDALPGCHAHFGSGLPEYPQNGAFAESRPQLLA